MSDIEELDIFFHFILIEFLDLIWDVYFLSLLIRFCVLGLNWGGWWACNALFGGLESYNNIRGI